MVHIVLNADQARVLALAVTTVEIRDETGRVLGQVPAPTEAQIIERIKRDRSSDIARYPAEQVQGRLRRLEEIRQQEGMDQAKMHELLGRMRAGEEV